MPQHCSPLLSSSPTAAGQHRPQGGGLHVSSAPVAPVPRQQLLSWYSSLDKQVGTVSKKRDPGLLMQQCKWVDARKFVALS